MPTRYESAQDVAVVGNDVYVTGRAGITDDPTGVDLFLLKLHDDGSSVSVVDSTFSNYPGDDGGIALGVLNGIVYVAGSRDAGGNSDSLLAAYDTNLNPLWDTSWGTPDDDHPLDLAIHDGRIYIAGMEEGYTRGFVNAYRPAGPADCNGNTVDDAEDIASGTSADCNSNGIPDECEIDVASSAPGGPYFCTASCDPDCNDNGTPDECELESNDCNNNGVPDSCEPNDDCNANGIQDICDLITGFSGDCNANEIPDECDIGCPIALCPATTPQTSLDCNENEKPDECEIDAASAAPGGPFSCTSECDSDCNDNGVPDECDVANGIIVDCSDPITLDWSTTFVGLGSAYAVGVAVNENAVYVSGPTNALGQPADMFLLKIDRANGVPVWEDTWGGSDHESGARLALFGSEVRVGGNSRTYAYDPLGDREGDAVTVKWLDNGVDATIDSSNSADGWWTRYSGDAGYYGTDSTGNVAMDDSGNVYVTGGSERGWANTWAYVEKYDADGVKLWHQHYGWSGAFHYSSAGGVFLTGDAIYVAGSIGANVEDYQATILKYSTADGTLVWELQWGLPTRYESAQDVVVVGNDVYVTGRAGITADTTGVDLFLLKLHDDGPSVSVVDSTFSSYPGDDGGIALGVLNGIVYVAGSRDAGGNSDSLLAAYDTNLSPLWDTSWGGPENDFPLDLAIYDGRIYIAGMEDEYTRGFVNAYRVPGPADCNGNGVDDADDIAAGTSGDCNANGIPDRCEIDVASSAPGGPYYCTAGCDPDCNDNGAPDGCELDGNDCNSNSVPDTCEPNDDCNTNDTQDICDLAACDGDPLCSDCNYNGIPDKCDIDDGTSLDAGGNDIPDECEDCNGNGVADLDDVSTGTSEDCNGNAIPDECDIGCLACPVPTTHTSIDCNANDLPDECEIDESSTAPGGPYFCDPLSPHPSLDGCDPDCQPNGIPDECEISGVIESLWRGGPGTWGDTSKWCPELVPNNWWGDMFTVTVPSVPNGALESAVTLDLSPTVLQLTIEANARVEVNWNSGASRMLASLNPIANDGMIRAADGRMLVLFSLNVIQGGGGVLEADGKESVIMIIGGPVEGGTLRSVNGGEIELLGGGTLKEVTVVGTGMVIPDGEVGWISGTIHNDGDITIKGVDSTLRSQLQPTLNNAVLSGSGHLVLTNQEGALLGSMSDIHRLTNDGGHTIEGKGEIIGTLINEASAWVLANEADGELRISGPGEKTNNGVFGAVNGGVLVLNSMVYQGSEGLIAARNEGMVVIQEDIEGYGRLEVSCGGVVINDVSTSFAGVAILDRIGREGHVSLDLTGSASLVTTQDFEIGSSAPSVAARGGCDPPGMRAADASQIRIGGKFNLIGGAAIEYTSSAPMMLAGDFENQSVAPGSFNWESGALVLNGAGAQEFEVAGVDRGPTLHPPGPIVDGFDSNFVMGTVEVGAESVVTFRDSFDNDGKGQGACTEALYVRNFTVRADATVTVENCRIYVRSLEVEEGASVLPEPGGNGNCPAIVLAGAGDADEDGDVDLCDSRAFCDCLTGPGLIPSYEPPFARGCESLGGWKVKALGEA